MLEGRDNSEEVVMKLVNEQGIPSVSDIKDSKAQESAILYCGVQEKVLTSTSSSPPIVIYFILLSLLMHNISR